MATLPKRGEIVRFAGEDWEVINVTHSGDYSRILHKTEDGVFSAIEDARRFVQIEIRKEMPHGKGPDAGDAQGPGSCSDADDVSAHGMSKTASSD